MNFSIFSSHNAESNHFSCRLVFVITHARRKCRNFFYWWIAVTHSGRTRVEIAAFIYPFCPSACTACIEHRSAELNECSKNWNTSNSVAMNAWLCCLHIIKFIHLTKYGVPIPHTVHDKSIVGVRWLNVSIVRYVAEATHRLSVI